MVKFNAVISGGRQIGFPTANIGLEHEMVLRGVYVVRVTGLDREYFGVANIGQRPTVDGLKKNARGAYLRL